MLETGVVTEFYKFLGEYSKFFENMAKCEKEKLDAILQNKLPLLESTIATAQANAMQLSNMERKRLELQKKAGFEGKTFRQLVEAAQEQNKEELRRCFECVEDSVSEIKYYNTKAMQLAESNLHLFGIATKTGATEPLKKLTSQQKTNDTATPRLEIKA